MAANSSGVNTPGLETGRYGGVVNSPLLSSSSSSLSSSEEREDERESNDCLGEQGEDDT